MGLQVYDEGKWEVIKDDTDGKYLVWRKLYLVTDINMIKLFPRS